MARPRRIWMWGGGAAVAAVLLTAAAIVALRSDAARDAALGLLVAELEKEDVRIARTGGAWPEEIVAEDIAVSDGAGAWLTIRRLTIRLAPWRLLWGEAFIERAVVEGAELGRLPQDDAEEGSGDPWPRLPVALTVRDLTGDLRVGPDVLGAPFAAAVAASGYLAGDAAELALAVERSDGPGARLRGRWTLEQRGARFALEAGLQDDALLAESLDEPALADLALTLDIARSAVWSGAVDAATPALGRAAGRIDADGVLALTLADAGLAAQSLGLAAAGPVTLAASLPAVVFGGEGPVSLDLASLRASDPALARVLAGAAAQARLVRGERSWRFQDLSARFASGSAAATGHAALTEGRLQGALSLALDSLAVQAPPLAGRATGEVNVSGTWGAPEAALALALRDVRVGGEVWPQADLQARYEQGAASATLTAQGDLPLTAEASVNPAQRFALDGKVAGATLRARADLASEPFGLSAEIDAPDLSRFARLASVPLSGRAALSAEIAPGLGSVSARLTSAAATVGGAALRDLSLTVDGAREAAEWRASAAVDTGAGPFALTAQGTAALADAPSLAVAQAQAVRGGVALALTAPAQIAFADGIAVRDVRAALRRRGAAAGVLAASAQRTGGVWSADAEASGVALAALGDLFAPDLSAGRLDATLALDGPAQTGAAQAAVTGLVWRGAGGAALPAADVTARAEWRDGRLAAEGEAKAAGLRAARLTATLQAPRGEGGFPAVTGATPLQAEAVWQGRVGVLWNLLNSEGDDLTGDGDIRLSVGGTIARPALSGVAAVTEGEYRNDESGARLRDLSLRLEASAAGGVIALQAVDGAGGGVRGEGSFAPQDTLGTARVRFDLDRLQAIARADLRARLTGALDLAPQGEGLALTGALTVSDASVDIAAALPPAVVEVEVIDPAAPPAPQDEGAPPAFAVALGVDVDVPGPVPVTGRGLDSLWRGRLRIEGTADAPRIQGELRALRGGLDFAGRRLELTRGVIAFDGGAEIDPRLDIVSSVAAGGVDAEIGVGGRLTAPELAATSTPPLPQDEVLSRVLFGKSVRDLSALEALQLARSVAELSGGFDAGGDLLGGLRRRFGLDVLTLEGAPGEEGGPAVSAGSYLSDRVFVGVRQGAQAGSTRARVEIEVTDDISLETDVGPDAGSSAGVTWQRDY